MLDFFRQKGLTSVIYGIIIVGMILVFVLGFNPSAGKKLGSVSEACAARIKGNCIEPKAHRASYRLVFSRGTGGMKQATASRIVLEGLIERELLVAEAQRFGLTVSENEINDSIIAGNVLVSMPSDNVQLQRQLGIDDGKVHVGFKDPKTKQFEMKTYERLVKQLTGRSPTEFREWQSRELLASKMRDLIRAPVRVAEDEGFDRFKLERTTSTVNYVVVRKGWLEKYALKVDAKELDAAKAKAKEASEGVKKKAEDVLARVKKGEDFGKLAKEFSEDPGSKDNNGEYPGEMVAQFVEPFKKAVDEVKPGELVPHLVETTFGYHIIKRELAKDGKLPPVRHILVKYSGEKPDDAEKKFKEGKAVELAKDVAKFITAELKAGKPSDDVLKAAIAKYGVLKPEKKAEKPKGDAKPAGDAGAGDASASADAAPAAPEFTAETDPERPQLLTSSAFNRGGDPIPAISGEASMEVTTFAFSAKVGDVIAEPIRTDDGYLIVSLKDQKPATKEEFDKERDQYLQGLLFAKKAEALANYTRRLREANKGDIKVDENNVMGAKSDAGPSQMDDDEGP
ncbi:MAG: peptidylprolyl isomerase [Deltaproteobacteria bacterium]|nr:peptidylprolyl isomerase [Deltaproteobacteria bacterium]